MDALLTPFLILVPVVVAVVELAKGLGVPTRFAGLVAVIAGIGLVLLIGEDLAGDDVTLNVELVAGLVVGLAAAGLYSASRAAVGSDT